MLPFELSFHYLLFIERALQLLRDAVMNSTLELSVL